jgi:hypothetical protein
MLYCSRLAPSACVSCRLKLAKSRCSSRRDGRLLTISPSARITISYPHDDIALTLCRSAQADDRQHRTREGVLLHATLLSWSRCQMPKNRHDAGQSVPCRALLCPQHDVFSMFLQVPSDVLISDHRHVGTFGWRGVASRRDHRPREARGKQDRDDDHPRGEDQEHCDPSDWRYEEP